MTSQGLGIRTPERGLGPLHSLGTTGTPGKEGEDYDLSGPGDQELPPSSLNKLLNSSLFPGNELRVKLVHLKRDIDDSFIKKTVFEGKRERTKAKVSAMTTKNSINNTGLACSDRNPKSCVLKKISALFNGFSTESSQPF